MRRNDREVTDWDQILEIVSSSKVCRLGLLDGTDVYIVPLNFGFCADNAKLTLFFHSALEGRKVRLLHSSDAVSFEMDNGHRLITGDRGCSFSFAYQCVMGSGKVIILEDKSEKIEGMNRIMLHQTGKSFSFEESDINRVLVFKMEVLEISAKRKA